MSASRPSRAGGFTLMELTVSLTVSAMLMAALGSAVAIAAAALPGEDRRHARTLEGGHAIERIGADLEAALYVLSDEPASPAYAIPDRDGDGAPDTQLLAWSGGAADPLTLVENNATPETLLERVVGFDVSFDVALVAETYPTSSQDAPLSEVASYKSVNDGAVCTLTPDTLWGQVVTPALPADALSWSPERVELALRRYQSAGATVRAELRSVDTDGRPTDTVLDSVTFPESDLGDSYAWHAIDFPSPPTLDPGERVCVVLAKDSGSGYAGEAVADSEGVGGLWDADVSGGLLDPLLGGDDSADWTTKGAEADWTLLHRLHATYTTPGPDGSVSHRVATSAHIDLRLEAGADTEVGATVNLVNRPLMVDAVWESHFSVDPTVLDVNADGVGDWARVDGAPFDSGDLKSGGWWDARDAIKTQPPADLPGVVIAEIRWRCTDHTEPGVAWSIAFDQGGGTQGNVRLQLAKTSETDQAIVMTTGDGAGTTRALAVASGLGEGMIDTRVLVNPAAGEVALRVNGTALGGHPYMYEAVTDDGRVSVIQPLGDKVEIDYVRIRAGSVP